MKEMVRAIFAPGLTVDAVAELIDRLLARLSRSRLKPFVRLGRTIRKHRPGILAARRLNLSNARAEAMNNRVKLIVRRAYGFHSANAALALVHLTCGPVTLTLPHEQPSLLDLSGAGLHQVEAGCRGGAARTGDWGLSGVSIRIE
jgi:transposase